jgi:DNA replication protein DnaC
MAAIPRSEPFAQQACPLGVCDGSGWILGPEDVARPCQCRAERLRKGRLRGIASAIPARFRGVSFDRPPVSDMERDLEVRAVIRTVRNYIDDLDENLEAGRGLWLMGTPGTGKTTLAMLAAKEALARGKTVAIYFTPQLLNRIRTTYGAADAADAYNSFFKRLTSVDLLYIDDLGSERQSDWVVEQLYAIVNERYQQRGSMLLTSNAAHDKDMSKAMEGAQQQLEEQVGARTVSRLFEMCGEPMPLFGSDHRTLPRLSA